jgi:hypothetical protein
MAMSARRVLPAMFVLFATSPRAVAGEAVAGDAAAAATAFAEAQKAQLEGDLDRAADRFELANSIVPTREALRSAVRAHMQVGHLARAAMLSEQLLAKYAGDEASVSLARNVLRQARQKLGRVDLRCKDGCTVSIGSRALSMERATSHVFFLPPRSHSLRISFGDRSVARTVAVAAGADAVLDVQSPPMIDARVAMPAVSRPAAVEPEGGLPRAVPLVGLSLTVVSAGAATWSAIDTRRAHRDYMAEPDHREWLAGRSKQLRTNILWGATAGFGVLTLLAAYWTNWHPDEAPGRFALVPTGDDVMMVFSTPM